MHKATPDYPPLRSQLNAAHSECDQFANQSYYHEGYGRFVPGISRPEIINVMQPNRPMTIPGHRFETRSDVVTKILEEEQKNRRNYRALIGSAVLILTLVIGDHYARESETTEPAEQNPVAENGYYYDSENDYYYQLGD